MGNLILDGLLASIIILSVKSSLSDMQKGR